MKAIRLLMLIATGVMLMMGINSCDNKKQTDDKSSAQSKESQGQGSLVGCHLWGHTESDAAEAT